MGHGQPRLLSGCGCPGRRASSVLPITTGGPPTTSCAWSRRRARGGSLPVDLRGRASEASVLPQRLSLTSTARSHRPERIRGCRPRPRPRARRWSAPAVSRSAADGDPPGDDDASAARYLVAALRPGHGRGWRRSTGSRGHPRRDRPQGHERGRRLRPADERGLSGRASRPGDDHATVCQGSEYLLRARRVGGQDAEALRGPLPRPPERHRQGGGDRRRPRDGSRRTCRRGARALRRGPGQGRSGRSRS